MAPNGLLFMSFKTREDRRRVLGWPAKRRFAGGEGGRMPSKAGNIKGLEKIDKKKSTLIISLIVATSSIIYKESRSKLSQQVYNGQCFVLRFIAFSERLSNAAFTWLK